MYSHVKSQSPIFSGSMNMLSFDALAPLLGAMVPPAPHQAVHAMPSTQGQRDHRCAAGRGHKDAWELREAMVSRPNVWWVSCSSSGFPITNSCKIYTCCFYPPVGFKIADGTIPSGTDLELFWGRTSILCRMPFSVWVSRFRHPKVSFWECEVFCFRGGARA